MRKREKIEIDFPRSFKFTDEQRDGAKLILEVLLDIRDILDCQHVDERGKYHDH